MTNYSLSELETTVETINREMGLTGLSAFSIELRLPHGRSPHGWTRWKLEQGGSDIFSGTKAEFEAFIRGMWVMARYSPKR